MAHSAHQETFSSKIIEEIVTAGKAAFDPSATPQVREPALQAYQDLIASTKLVNKAEYPASMAEGPVIASSYSLAAET
ncbi:hypothetical protein E4U43_002575 [Claviceps pusilla]|uniref:Uncharacterized protein n=1 Tax=Claviceps pusilla TaxID=123648 RepID=A0A9P7NI86_9HYPO|nr:hypothetical protein E4U43_002575 [Claviceps pusilla]